MLNRQKQESPPPIPIPVPAAPVPSARLQLSVQYANAAEAALPARNQVRAWVAAALAADAPPAEITVRFVGADESQRLNHRYRRRNTPTNVLAFPYSTAPAIVGDIVVCCAVTEAEARRQNKPPHNHYAHLIVHGVLHLLGYRHDTAARETAMQSAECTILQRFKIANPYWRQT